MLFVPKKYRSKNVQDDTQAQEIFIILLLLSTALPTSTRFERNTQNMIKKKTFLFLRPNYRDMSDRHQDSRSDDDREEKSLFFLHFYF